MGRSGRPDIEYTLRDHVEYFGAFLDAIGVETATLVVHDVGGPTGLSWAAQNPERVTGVAMFETAFAPATGFDQIPNPEFAQILPLLRESDAGDVLVYEDNIFVESFLQSATSTELPEDVLDVYRARWADPDDRLPMRMWPTQLPIAGEPVDANELMTAAFGWITTTEVPRLLLYAEPGYLMPEFVAEFATSVIPELEIVSVGAGIHYLQEDNPGVLGEELGAWIAANDL